ncbi:MAG TPA: threonine synthase [Steroidobacteraceae bacterium]|nr:threonine synthase [Steroidobacteraceae bacterium]
MSDGLRLSADSHEADVAVQKGAAGNTLVSFAPVDVTGLRERIDGAEWSLWRYRAALPLRKGSEQWRKVSLGEGLTPLIDAGEGCPGLKLKLEYAMPTLSFKDRGAVLMVAKAKEWGVERLAADSSGNAGTAIAAYAARVGIACEIFVPASTSAGKLLQMEMHGARVHRVEGPRQAATDAAREFVEATGVFYASHVLNPYFFEGTKTYAYEIWEQLGYRAPHHVIVPVGHGTLVLGAYKGFLELLNAGYIDAMPRIYAIQAVACAPIAEAFAANTAVGRVNAAGTVAEGIAIANPPRGMQIIEAVRATGGDIIALTDDAVRSAREELAFRGLFVEPTGAVSFAAYREIYRSRFAAGEISVAPLCGAGLKSPYR